MYNNIKYHYSKHEPLIPTYMNDKVIKLERGRELFVDDYLIENLTNCDRKYYSAEKYLKKGIHWTRSHPITGSEVSGPEHGKENMFEEKWCVLIKDKKTSLKHLFGLIYTFLNSVAEVTHF